MRRLQIFTTLFLLAAEILWLSLQPLQSRQAALLPGSPKRVATVRGDGMTASIELESHMLLLRLTGHPAGVEPQLTVTAGGKALSSLLRDWESSGTETSVRLSSAGLNLFPARQITYTWEAGGKRVTGEHIYVNPEFPYTWQRVQRGPFIIYHTGSLKEEQVARWAGVYADMAAFLGMEPVQRTIYLMPDQQALERALQVKGPTGVAGFWKEPPLDALFLVPDYPPAALEELVTHELAHAFLVGPNRSFWHEGIAVWTTIQITRLHALRNGSDAYLGRLTALQKVMRTEGTFLMQATTEQRPPLDSYTVGFSFVLYLQDRFGKDAVVRLAVAAATRPLGEALQSTLGEGLGQLEEGWREYVKSGAHLKALGSF